LFFLFCSFFSIFVFFKNFWILKTEQTKLVINFKSKQISKLKQISYWNKFQMETNFKLEPFFKSENFSNWNKNSNQNEFQIRKISKLEKKIEIWANFNILKN
jgi:hypothetical protein